MKDLLKASSLGAVLQSRGIEVTDREWTKYEEVAMSTVTLHIQP